MVNLGGNVLKREKNKKNEKGSKNNKVNRAFTLLLFTSPPSIIPANSKGEWMSKGVNKIPE